jgi:hypothetical protein
LADPLTASLRPIRRRLLLVRAVEVGLAGAVGAAELAAVVTVIRIVLPQHVPVAAQYPALPLVLLPCGFAIGFLVRLAMGVSLREAALAADRAAGLKERLATALEVTDAATAGARPPGLLDDRLLDQATSAAGRLDVARLRLGPGAVRSAKILLVAVAVLAAASLIPPVGGPALAPQAADRAAAALEQLASQPAVASAVRAEIEKAVARLREPGARQAGADQATAAVVQAAARAEQSRRATVEELKKIDNPEVQAMVAAAAAGDAAGAADAAAKAAGKFAPPAAGGAGLPEADRRRIADGLTGAAQVARQEDLPRLAAELEAAAQALRASDPAAAEALGRLAGAMAESLREPPADAAAAVASAVAQARRAMGLPDAPAGPGAPMPGKGTVPVSEKPETGTVPSSAGGAVPAAIPPDVRPEDRDVVRRYFGG